MSEELTPDNEKDIVTKKVLKEKGKQIAGNLLESTAAEQVLVIRHDEPLKVLPIYEPVKFTADGVIDTAYRYLKKRVNLIDQLQTTVLVDREKMSINLHSNEKDHYGDKVGGKLSVHPDFIKFTINSGELMKPEKLGDFLRMNRFVFENKTEALKLVTLLKGFTANVNKIVEEKVTSNGDRRKIMDQTVEHNLPPAFYINLPLFKGQAPQRIEVEIVIDSQTLDCRLESPEAQEFMDKVKNEAIDEQIGLIQDVAPNVLIIEK